MKIYRAFAALLHYPSAELAAAAGDIAALVKEEGRVSRRARAAIDRLTAQLTLGDLLTAQEAYVGLFDQIAQPVAAYVRAYPRRIPRPRTGDGQPSGALRDARVQHRLQ